MLMGTSSSWSSGRCLGRPRTRMASVTAWRSCSRGPRSRPCCNDNHHPKGHHRHRGALQIAYTFSTIDQLLMDFLADVQGAKAGRKEDRK